MHPETHRENPTDRQTGTPRNNMHVHVTLNTCLLHVPTQRVHVITPHPTDVWAPRGVLCPLHTA